MKQLVLGVALMAAFSLPSAAGSIEMIDTMVTGAKGASKSIVMLGEAQGCLTACQIAAAPITTSSFASLALPGKKKINVAFARKFPDPAVPVPAPVDDGSNSAAADPLAAPAAPAAAGAPSAPADAGTIPPQPSVDQAGMRGTLKEPGVPEGAIDPSTLPVNNGQPKVQG
jgi:hypothetical protein